MNGKQTVEQGYDMMADSYLATKERSGPAILQRLQEFAAHLPGRARVLDLGCGAGVPVTRFLSERFEVTGVDISERQLELAQQNVPSARFIRSDMSALDFAAETFHAVVAFYSIIHLPREEQPRLVGKIYRWLKLGGGFLATWPLTEWEGEEENWQGWGATMWWSHYGQDENLRMLREAGFGVESVTLRRDNDEEWLWVVARKEK